MQYITASDGMRIAYQIDDFTDPWKKAATIVMLHSAMGSAHRFYSWVPALSKHYRVVRQDLRGHGRSQVPPAEPALTMERLVQDTLELMDHLGLDQAHLIGNSAGGYVAQNMAMSAGHRVKSISIFGSTPGLRQTQAASWLPKVAAMGLRPFLASTISDRFDLATTDPGRVEWFLDECAKNDTPFIGRFIGLMTSLDWSDRVAEIKCPTLVVMPGAETVGSTKLYDVMRDNIPDVELLAYEHMPHNICDAVPERCAADVLAYLKRRFNDAV
jgi:pimeloyl-ACP methyl ester carboxylesterase